MASYLVLHSPPTYNISTRKTEIFLGVLYSSMLTVFKKGKGSPYSITERRVPELIPVLGSRPVGDVSHKPDSRLLLLSTRPAVTLATLKS